MECIFQLDKLNIYLYVGELVWIAGRGGIVSHLDRITFSVNANCKPSRRKPKRSD